VYWKQIWETNNISVTVLPSCWQGCHCRVQYNHGSIVLCTTCRYHGSIITQTTRTIKVKWPWSAISSVPLTFLNIIFTVGYIAKYHLVGVLWHSGSQSLHACNTFHKIHWYTCIHNKLHFELHLVLGEMDDRNMKGRNQIHMWQSRVEIEHYSVAYFARIAAFEAL